MKDQICPTFETRCQNANGAAIATNFMYGANTCANVIDNLQHIYFLFENYSCDTIYMELYTRRKIASNVIKYRRIIPVYYFGVSKRLDLQLFCILIL